MVMKANGPTKNSYRRVYARKKRKEWADMSPHVRHSTETKVIRTIPSNDIAQNIAGRTAELGWGVRIHQI